MLGGVPGTYNMAMNAYEPRSGAASQRPGGLLSHCMQLLSNQPTTAPGHTSAAFRRSNPVSWSDNGLPGPPSIVRSLPYTGRSSQAA